MTGPEKPEKEWKPMNKVELSGRLTAEPISGSGANPNASPYARFTLAVNRRGGRNSDPDAQTADFISCVGFGKHSETIKNYLHKGSKVIITGRIQTGKYTNREGQTVYRRGEDERAPGSVCAGNQPVL